MQDGAPAYLLAEKDWTRFELLIVDSVLLELLFVVCNPSKIGIALHEPKIMANEAILHT